MRKAWMISLLLLVALAVSGRTAWAQEEVPQVDLGTPFALSVGEMMRVGPDGLEITLRSASDDSGCFAPNDCSVMTFNGTLAVKEGERRELMDVEAGFTPDKPVSIKFERYVVVLTAVRRDKARLIASFTVVPAPPEEKKDEEE